MNAEIIIRHIIAGFMCVDREWVVQRVNARASTMLRKINGDLEGKSLWEAFPGLAGTSAERVLRAVPLTPTEQRFDIFAAERHERLGSRAQPIDSCGGPQSDLGAELRRIAGRSRRSRGSTQNAAQYRPAHNGGHADDDAGNLAWRYVV